MNISLTWTTPEDVAIALADNPHGFGGNISMAGEQIRHALGRAWKRSAQTASSEGPIDVLGLGDVESAGEEVTVG